MQKKIIITQPTFLPYSGYFAALSDVDEIVFLDDVQFSKRSWQQRNIIRNINGPFYLTVPVRTKNKYDQKILNVEINNENNKWNKKMIQSIDESYKKSKFFDNYFPSIKEIIEKDFYKLIDLNIDLINLILNFLDLKVKIIFSSHMNNTQKKFDLIKEIYEKRNAKILITTAGVRSYFPKNSKNMNIIYFKYNDQHFKYNQMGKSFISNLSIIDLLFNEGKNCKKILKNNLFLSKKNVF